MKFRYTAIVFSGIIILIVVGSMILSVVLALQAPPEEPGDRAGPLPLHPLHGRGLPALSWWLLLTVLDVAAALHTVAMEEEDLGLVPLALAYRFFILLIDVSKIFATAEEFLKIEMTWGKLERMGRI